MKLSLLTLLVALLLAITGCTPMIYGVPQERWDRMSEPERVAAMDAYQAHQELLREQQRERARQQAMVEADRRAREAEANRLRQLQIEAIYRGDGAYGELLRITLEQGTARFGNSLRPYRPLTFKLAAGETKQLILQGQRGQQSPLEVSYDGRRLLLDPPPANRGGKLTELRFDPDWSWGTTYTSLFSHGPLELQNVNLSVEILGHRPRGYQARRRPRVIVVEKPTPPPPPRVVVGKEPPRQAPPVIIIKQPPTDAAPTENRRPRQDHPRQDGRETPPPVVEKHPAPRQPVDNNREHFRNDATARQVETQPQPPAAVSVEFKNQQQFGTRFGRQKPTTVILKQGEHRSITLRNGRSAIKLQLGYLDGKVMIDSRQGKRGRQTGLEFRPEWQQGQSYKLEELNSQLGGSFDVIINSR